MICFKDPYGNYVVQYVLDLEIDELTKSIVKKIAEEANTEVLKELSCHKFSSNVIEKVKGKSSFILL